uniref:Uncharacterized protein n=1 Tax=Setaria viridis TaxID=4556 RepID=A0A4U6TQG8_SETVI|nr:hypothetical protein SEVIR_7G139250v2 [Setaria viridis]
MPGSTRRGEGDWRGSRVGNGIGFLALRLGRRRESERWRGVALRGRQWWRRSRSPALPRGCSPAPLGATLRAYAYSRRSRLPHPPPRRGDPWRRGGGGERAVWRRRGEGGAADPAKRRGGTWIRPGGEDEQEEEAGVGGGEERERRGERGVIWEKVN